MAKTIAGINEIIRRGKAVVVTAEEVIGLAKRKGVRRAGEKIDVVTTAICGPVCSSVPFLISDTPTGWGSGARGNRVPWLDYP